MKNGLLTLINSEDKKNPFTDKELSEQLNIRRDAVTTLRGELGISDSRERRKPYLSKALTEILAKNPKASDRELTRLVKEQGFNVSRFLISQLRVGLGVNSIPPKKKKVVVACGTGIATSTVVSDKIVEACKKEGIDVEVAQCKLVELRSYTDGADLIVTTTILRGDFDIPVVSGLPFITGIGENGNCKHFTRTQKLVNGYKNSIFTIK